MQYWQRLIAVGLIFIALGVIVLAAADTIPWWVACVIAGVIFVFVAFFLASINKALSEKVNERVS
jgi:uncharacterized membrane protein